MPLTRAQAEDFIQAFFRDHRLPAPPVDTRKKFLVTVRPRKRLNLPPVITRQALADQVAAHLCRACVKRLALRHRLAHQAAICRSTRTVSGAVRPRIARHFNEWQKYVRGVVVRQFGKGDGLK